MCGLKPKCLPKRCKTTIAPAIAAKGKGMVLVAGGAVINVTPSIGTFAAQHLLLFFALYRSYLPPVDEIIVIPIVVIGEDVLY